MKHLFPIDLPQSSWCPQLMVAALGQLSPYHYVSEFWKSQGDN
jgi:hypothetical protein